MNSLKNRVQLIGHLGGDPEIVQLKNNGKLAKFSLATNDYYKNNEGERVTQTQWHSVVAWGKTAELVETLLVKGAEVAVEGKLMHRDYEDKEGNKKYVTEVQVSELLLLKKKE